MVLKRGMHGVWGCSATPKEIDHEQRKDRHYAGSRRGKGRLPTETHTRLPAASCTRSGIRRRIIVCLKISRKQRPLILIK